MSAYSSLVLGDGPRAYWRLGEAAVPVVDSVNGISFGSGAVGGTLVFGQPSLLAGDVANNSISFNTGWLSQGGGMATLDVRDVFTVEAWVQLRTLSNPAHMSIYSNWSGGQYLRINSSNKLEVASSNTQSICIATAAISDLKPHHVVATKNGPTVKLYIDGVDVTGAVTNYTFANAPTWMAIGYDPGGGGESANMVLDEVALYPVALSQAQVLAHYNVGSTGPTPQTVQVPSVYPAGSVPTIVQTFLVEDGHVVDGVLVSQFGTVTPHISFPQTIPVGGVYPPGYVSSITGQVVSGDGHLVGGSGGGQFGTPTIITGPVRPAAGGVSSAQAFGVPTARSSIGTPTGGVGTAQTFGDVAIFARVWVLVSGLGSEQAFGDVTPERAAVKVPVGGVPSSQVFGLPNPVYVVRPPNGVESAQVFGQVTIATAVTVPVAGLESEQAFGDTKTGLAVFNTYLHELDCLTDGEPAICGEVICGGAICGGAEVYLNEEPELELPLEEIECLTGGDATICGDPTLCGEWLCAGEDLFLYGVPDDELELEEAPVDTTELEPAGCA